MKNSKIKNTLFGILIIIGTTLVSCGNNVGISEEDKVFPSNSSLNYNDYEDDSVYDKTKWYKNELKDLPLPDPFVIEEEGKYYVFGTTDRTGAKTFDCYETEDFSTWQIHRNIYVPSNLSFTKQSLFAPEVYKIDGKFYLYYSGKPNDTTSSAVNVLVSDYPYGPYVEYKGKNALNEDVNYVTEPLIKDTKSGLGLGILDQTLLVDGEDIYMYYSVYDTGSMQYIVGFKMLDPVTVDLSTYKILVRPGELSPATKTTNTLGWEALKNFKVAEGPCVIKSPVNGKFYMTYSVNHYPDRYYTVCYAYSDDPLGDYTKPYEKNGNWTNIFFGYAGGLVGTIYDQWDGFMSGTAHHSIFKVGEEYMIVYHAHKNRKDSNGGRYVAFDHVYFDEEGVPYTHGPTYSLSPLPTLISGYENISLKSSIKTENIVNPQYINDNYIVEHYQLEQENKKEVLLNKGKSYIEIDFDKIYSVGGIQIFNSATYGKHIYDIKYINFFNNNSIINTVFPSKYIQEDKNFIYPGSAFTYYFEDIQAEKVVICFDNDEDKQINEVAIYGRK